MTHYIYCSTFISTIILRVLIILLFICYYFYYCYYHYDLFYLLTSFNIYLDTDLLIRGPIRPEGSPFGWLFNPGMLRDEGVVSTQTFVYNPSIQPSRECLIFSWMVNSHYGLYHP